ncbi:MAG: hypothetical protein K1000chlam2_01703 [Chlamydiae bacterium]|nr:hypothetical protein [Chlamydiota bacterium]
MAIGPLGNEARAELNSFKTLPQMKEFDNNSTDTITSAASDKKESWGKSMTWLLCFIPGMLWGAVKHLIYFASCCKLCKPAIDPKQVQKALEPLQKSWGDSTVKKEDKVAAWKKFCEENPRAKSDIIEAWIIYERDIDNGLKKDLPEKIEEWNKVKRESIEKKVENQIAACDSQLLVKYGEYLKPKVDATQS